MHKPLSLATRVSALGALAVLAASTLAAIAVRVSPAAAQPAIGGQLVITELRTRGPGGDNDEFVEIYNNSGADHIVAASSGAGYGVVASDGVLRCTIANGTLIPNRGHFLCVNSVGYSLANYPAGVTALGATTATGDTTYTTDIPTNAGVALFTSTTTFTAATRLDAAGSTGEANTLFKEGAGYTAIDPAFAGEHSFVRVLTTSSTNSPTTASAGATPHDTNDNSADFMSVDTAASSLGGVERLGAPGPEGLSSPIAGTPGISLVDDAVTAGAPPNSVRDNTVGSPGSAALGTLTFRRKITNNTGVSLTRLRLRIADLATFANPPGVADLRVLTASDELITLTSGQQVPVVGAVLEEPPAQATLGGGFNSSLTVPSVTAATPLANNASVNVAIQLGVMKTGTAHVRFTAEALPGLLSPVDATCLARGDTEFPNGCPATAAPPSPTAGTVTVASSPNPSLQSQNVTFTATVNPNVAGTVQFFDGATPLGGPVPVSSGQASLTTPLTTVGNHTITATFTPTGGASSSTSPPITHVVREFACTRTVNGSTGSVNVAAGEVVCVINATVNGSVTVAQGGALSIHGSSVSQNLLGYGPAGFYACRNTIRGVVEVWSATGLVYIGEANNDDGLGCGGNYVAGYLLASNNKRGSEISANYIGSDLTLNNVTGRGPFADDNAPEIEANYVVRNLSCAGNVPPPTNGGKPNTVRGTRSGQCVGL